MELSEKDRDDFLQRKGAVQKVRENGEEVPGAYVEESGKEWDDDDILMLIASDF